MTVIKRHSNRVSAAIACVMALTISAGKTLASEGDELDNQGIVRSVFQNYLKRHKNVRLDIARSKISPTQSALVVRFASPETCRSGYCTTAVLLYSKESDSWEVAFERHAKDLRIIKKTGRAGLYYLEADKVIWEWNGGPSFYPMVSSLGEPFRTIGNTPPPRITSSTEEILHSKEWLKSHPFSANSVYKISAIHLPANNMSSVWFVYAYAPGECGDAGCPSAILQDTSDGTRPLWLGSSDGEGATSNKSTGEWKDILISTRQGYKALSFDGSNYKVKYTSYRSSYTPSP